MLYNACTAGLFEIYNILDSIKPKLFSLLPPSPPFRIALLRGVGLALLGYCDFNLVSILLDQLVKLLFYLVHTCMPCHGDL